MGKLKYTGKFIIKINANALSALSNTNTLSNANASSAIFKSWLRGQRLLLWSLISLVSDPLGALVITGISLYRGIPLLMHPPTIIIIITLINMTQVT